MVEIAIRTERIEIDCRMLSSFTVLLAETKAEVNSVEMALSSTRGTAPLFVATKAVSPA